MCAELEDVVHGVQTRRLLNLGVWREHDVRKGHDEREDEPAEEDWSGTGQSGLASC
jgi:hypothetical protein